MPLMSRFTSAFTSRHAKFAHSNCNTWPQRKPPVCHHAYVDTTCLYRCVSYWKHHVVCEQVEHTLEYFYTDISKLSLVSLASLKLVLKTKMSPLACLLQKSQMKLKSHRTEMTGGEINAHYEFLVTDKKGKRTGVVTVFTGSTGVELWGVQHIFYTLSWKSLLRNVFIIQKNHFKNIVLGVQRPKVILSIWPA